MELSQYFKSIVDQDRCAIVICNPEHELRDRETASRYDFS